MNRHPAYDVRHPVSPLPQRDIRSRPPVTGHATRPWHKEPWPWLLMAGPAAVIVAGAITTWLAITTADGLVADDYYKRGLAINRELDRDRAAAARGIAADVDASGGVLRVRLTGGAEPEALFARLVHATRAGHDQRLRLTPTGTGTYETALPELAPGRWRLILEDVRGEWRIVREAL